MVPSLNEIKYFRTSIIKYFSNLPDIDERYIFGSYDGLRLTYNGYMLLSSKLENYTFTFEKEFVMTAGIILKLNKLTKPYYYNNKFIVLFGKEDYVSLALMSDITLWINSIK